MDDYLLGYHGELDQVKTSKFCNLVMVTIGCSDALLEHKGEAARLKELMWWCLEQGVSPLWCLDHRASVGPVGKSNSFFSRVSMLKGPGDVKKGTFIGSVTDP